VTGDIALIEGSDEEEYNGAFVITFISGTAFSYTYPGGGSGAPTGTIVVTGGYFNELTNASGIVTDTRSISVDQPMYGYVAKASVAPYYERRGIVTTIDANTGRELAIQLALDQ
jgi:hypothetical protein